MKVFHPEKLDQFKSIKAILFDWDGVFHSGHKNHLGESSFSEADSMGLNLIRLGLFLEHGEIPYTAIITGEQNPTAHYLAGREHLHGLFYGVKDKKIILDHLLDNYAIAPHEILFVFDDVLDLSLARAVGFRFMVKREASKILFEHAKHQDLLDFYTTKDGGEHAVREITEFLLDTMGVFKKTIDCRVNFGEEYQIYWNKRQAIATQKMTVSDFQLVSE